MLDLGAHRGAHLPWPAPYSIEIPGVRGDPERGSWSFRDTALAGSAVLVIGTALSLLLTQHARLLQVAGVCFVIGTGLGLASTPVIVALQSVVGWDRRGVVTGTNMFFRSIGSAVGAAIFGAIANTTLTRRFTNPPAAVHGQLPHNADATSLVLGGRLKAAPGQVANYIRDSLFAATHNVFIAMTVTAALGVLAVTLMPRRTRPLPTTRVQEESDVH